MGSQFKYSSDGDSIVISVRELTSSCVPEGIEMALLRTESSKALYVDLFVYLG